MVDIIQKNNVYELKNGVKIRLITEPYCGWCGKPVMPNYKKCVDCNNQHPAIKIYAAGIYLLEDKRDPGSKIYHDTYPLNNEIWRLKNSIKSAYSAADNLGECIEYLINNSYQYLKSFDLIVAAPPNDMDRGFNQAALLAKNISERVDIPFVDVLYKKISPPPQHYISYDKKEENVKGIYSSNERVNNIDIIIIDDICTTRNTMNNCAKALKRCGAKEIRGFVVGRSTDVRNIKYIKQEEKYDIYQGRLPNE